MKEDCLFCKIANKEIETEIVYEDDDVMGFKDVNPQAPVHLLFIPKKHIDTLNDISGEDSELLGNLLNSIKKAASENNISDDGYRVVVNCNKNAGQEVFHLHIHLLGGRSFTWPPG